MNDEARRKLSHGQERVLEQIQVVAVHRRLQNGPTARSDVTR